MSDYETFRSISIRANMLMGEKSDDMTVSASLGLTYLSTSGAGKMAVGTFLWPINIFAAPVDWVIGRPTGFLHCQRAADAWILDQQRKAAADEDLW